MEFYKQEKQLDGSYTTDPDQLIRIKADFIILAFGSVTDSVLLTDTLQGVKLDKWGTSHKWVHSSSFLCDVLTA